MKKIQLFLVIAFLSLGQYEAFAQMEDSVPPKQVYVGFTGGMSFFGPSGVNDRIKSEVGSNVSYEQGFPEIVMNLSVSMSVIYKINESADVAGILDLALAPKFIYYSNGGGYDFYFFRFSPGVIGNLYFGTSRESKFFIGGGALVNFMQFEDFSGISPGIRLQAGQSFRMGSVTVKAMGVINVMPQAKDEYQGYHINLNYTDIGGVVGIEF
jgi:hypothetical protein